MKRAVFGFLFALTLAPAALAADPYELLLYGVVDRCDHADLNAGYQGTYAGGQFQDRFEGASLQALAAGPNGRIFGLVNFGVVEVKPDFSLVSVFPGAIVAAPAELVVAAGGTMHIVIEEMNQLVTIAPDGTRTERTLPGVRIRGGIDLAADQCTLYYIDNYVTIKRFNVCTGTPLPDFATAIDSRDVRLLPGGDVLVTRIDALLRFNSAGTLVRTYAVERGTAIGLANGGTQAYVTHRCDELGLVRVDLSSGAVTGLPFTRSNAFDILPYRGWSAALGSHVGEDVPTASTFALALLGMAVVAAAFLRLR